MRPIECRAWVEKENYMYYGIDPFDIVYGSEAFDNYGWKADEEKCFDAMVIGKDNYHLMWFTGSFDENGKKIHDGDIVLKHDGKTKAIVYWDNSMARFSLNPEWYGEAEGNALDGTTVIGNKYQNVELFNEIELDYEN